MLGPRRSARDEALSRRDECAPRGTPFSQPCRYARAMRVLCMIALAMALPLGEPQLATFVDSRDGQRYRTLRFAAIEWMRDNLAFRSDPSWCYDDREEE